MILKEFKNFIDNFFKDDKEVLDKIDQEEVFKDFSKDEPNTLSERE